MQITCPNCSFSKQIDPAILPPDATRGTCPRCAEEFNLPVAGTRDATTAHAEVAIAPAELSAKQALIDGLPKAGFWLRVVATVIDTVLVGCLQTILSLLLGVIGVASATGSDELGTMVMLFGVVLGFAYYIVFTGHGGQTPGKMALRIKVICCDGGEIGYGKAAFREVIGKFISGIILCIGYLMVAFDEQKQGLHDRMAETYVIKL